MPSTPPSTITITPDDLPTDAELRALIGNLSEDDRTALAIARVYGDASLNDNPLQDEFVAGYGEHYSPLVQTAGVLVMHAVGLLLGAALAEGKHASHAAAALQHVLTGFAFLGEEINVG